MEGDCSWMLQSMYMDAAELTKETESVVCLEESKDPCDRAQPRTVPRQATGSQDVS